MEKIILVHYIFVGNISPQDISEYMESIMKNYNNKYSEENIISYYPDFYTFSGVISFYQIIQ